MLYRIKRLDPFWFTAPIVPGLALASVTIALYAAQSGRGAVAAGAGLVCGVAVFLATKPALSGVFAVFGLLGGIVTFLVGPPAGLSPMMRAFATLGFSVFYMVLMDGVLISVCAIYNLFSRSGLRGPALRLES